MISTETRFCFYLERKRRSKTAKAPEDSHRFFIELFSEPFCATDPIPLSDAKMSQYLLHLGDSSNI